MRGSAVEGATNAMNAKTVTAGAFTTRRRAPCCSRVGRLLGSTQALLATLLVWTLTACGDGVTLTGDGGDEAAGDAAGDRTVEDAGPDSLLDANHEEGIEHDGDAPEAVLDFSGCTPSPFRQLSTTDYTGPTGSPLAITIEDRTAFESMWLERYCYVCRTPPVAPPALPEVDFGTERVVWHHFVFRNTHVLLVPEVLDCGDRIVVRPRFRCTYGEMQTTVFTLIALSRSELAVEFTEPVEVPSL